MGSLVLLDLLGGVALLLWGLHMVLSGVLRAFALTYDVSLARRCEIASPLSVLGSV
jgi:phosphate:Na+ symporter